MRLFLFCSRHAMKMLGEELSDEEVEQMMKEADENGDGKINFEGTLCIKCFSLSLVLGKYFRKSETNLRTCSSSFRMLSKNIKSNTHLNMNFDKIKPYCVEKRNIYSSHSS